VFDALGVEEPAADPDAKTAEIQVSSVPLFLERPWGE
jgi:hypothetical protein